MGKKRNTYTKVFTKEALFHALKKAGLDVRGYSRISHVLEDGDDLIVIYEKSLQDILDT